MSSLENSGFEVVGLSPSDTLELGDIPIGSQFFLHVKNALDRIGDGQVLEVLSSCPSLQDDLRSWCRVKQHRYIGDLEGGKQTRFLIQKGTGQTPHGLPDWGVRIPVSENGNLSVKDWFQGKFGMVLEQAPSYLGFFPRGAVPDSGIPDFSFSLNRKKDVWAGDLLDLYEQAKANQWNASKDIPWRELPELSEEMERAVCQLMTFLAENEYSALYIPAKFMAQIHPHYIEAVMYLSTVVQDESRHIEAFVKRSLVGGGGLQYSSVLTQRSLHSLFIQEDYFKSSFLLHVLGEGTFLDLLNFIYEYAPDPVTKKVVNLAKIDEGRHVAYGIYHVRDVLSRDPYMVRNLIDAAEERKEYMDDVSGENTHVLEALAVLSGGGSNPDQLKQGAKQVEKLQQEMYEHRIQRMLQIGIDRESAAYISASHTPNFM